MVAMHRRHLTALAASAALLAGCGVPNADAPAASSTQASEAATTAKTPASTSGPTQQAVPSTAASYVRVPSAGIDQSLIPGGLSEAGTISPDKGEVMWFTGNDRVEPGRKGTAVVAAHVDYAGEPDVFTNLEDASPGETITVGYADGSEVEFTITAAEVIEKSALQNDPRVWGRQTDRAELVLVTCDDALGFRDDGHRSANLVVFASPAQT